MSKYQKFKADVVQLGENAPSLFISWKLLCAIILKVGGMRDEYTAHTHYAIIYEKWFTSHRNSFDCSLRWIYNTISYTLCQLANHFVVRSQQHTINRMWMQDALPDVHIIEQRSLLWRQSRVFCQFNCRIHISNHHQYTSVIVDTQINIYSPPKPMFTASYDAAVCRNSPVMV